MATEEDLASIIGIQTPKDTLDEDSLRADLGIATMEAGDGGPEPIAPTITTDAALYVLEGRTLVRGMSATGDEPIAWSLTGGADVALFEIDEDTGALSFLVAPVYASPADANADGVYIVDVTAENDGGDDAKTLSIHVLRRPTRPNMGANRKGRR